MRLGRLASGKIDWRTVEDSVGMLSEQYRGSEATAAAMGSTTLLSHEDRERVQHAFAAARDEFAKAAAWLRTVMQLAIAAMLIAAAAVFVIGLFSRLSPWRELISLAGLGTILVLARQVWRLGRDQVMLDTLPSRYELAISLCSTPHDVQTLIAKFLTETSELRSK